MGQSLLALASVAASALAAQAPGAAQGPGIGQVNALATLNGTCEHFLMAGRELAGNCNGAVLNTIYNGGRSSFMFTMADGSIVSFFGRDSKAVGGKATLFVDKITVKDGTNGTNPSTAAASGTCAYTNPYAGRSTIVCSATAMGRKFEARFVSDGRPPDVARP